MYTKRIQYNLFSLSTLFSRHLWIPIQPSMNPLWTIHPSPAQEPSLLSLTAAYPWVCFIYVLTIQLSTLNLCNQIGSADKLLSSSNPLCSLQGRNRLSTHFHQISKQLNIFAIKDLKKKIFLSWTFNIFRLHSVWYYPCTLVPEILHPYLYFVYIVQTHKKPANFLLINTWGCQGPSRSNVFWSGRLVAGASNRSFVSSTHNGW